MQIYTNSFIIKGKEMIYFPTNSNFGSRIFLEKVSAPYLLRKKVPLYGANTEHVRSGYILCTLLSIILKLDSYSSLGNSFSCIFFLNSNGVICTVFLNCLLKFEGLLKPES